MSSKKKNTKVDFEFEWRNRFNQFAGTHDDDAGIAGWSQTGLETRVRNFSTLWESPHVGSLWLDAGCGAGTYSRFLQSKGMQLVALDYCLAAVEKAKERSPDNIYWGVADVNQLPLKPGTFDGVMCFGVTQALSDSESVTRELARVVKPGGEVWIDGLNSWCLLHIFGNIKRILTGRDMHLRYEAPHDLCDTMKSVGFNGMKRYWIPILPYRLQRFQWMLETRVVRWLLHTVPPIGALLSHSFVIKAQKIS